MSIKTPVAQLKLSNLAPANITTSETAIATTGYLSDGLLELGVVINTATVAADNVITVTKIQVAPKTAEGTVGAFADLDISNIFGKGDADKAQNAASSGVYIIVNNGVYISLRTDLIAGKAVKIFAKATTQVTATAATVIEEIPVSLQ